MALAPMLVVVALGSRFCAANPLPFAAKVAAIVAREADVIVPEWEAKWEALQPERGRFEFGSLQQVVRFAQANGQRVRGHALLWHMAMPAWLEPALREGPAQASTIKQALTDLTDNLPTWHYYAGTAADLKKVYETLSSRLTVEKKETEISGLLALAAALLAITSAGLSLLWFGRVA